MQMRMSQRRKWPGSRSKPSALHHPRLSFNVPDTRQWTRIRKEWGNPRYVVYATEDRYPSSPWIIPFSTLSLDVDVSRAGLAIPVQRSACPYAVSRDTGDCGVDFKADPGHTFDVSLTLDKPGLLPAGNLVIEPFWDEFLKDRLVGAGIASEIEPYFRRLATLGVSLLVASGVIRTLYSIQQRRT